MRNSYKKYTKFLFFVPLILFSIGLYFISPTQIVSFVGVENSYLFMFVIALIGGISLFSGVPYPVILVTLASWGLNPILLGSAAAFWVILGDSTSYLVWKKSDVILPQKMQFVLNKLLFVYDRYPKFLPFTFLIYGICSPFPNDVITVSAGLRNYNFWKTIIPLWIGNLVFCICLAQFSDYFSTIFY